MSIKAKQEAEHFLNNEKQYHLGILPTEQSNPKTRNLDQKFAASPAEGIKMLLSVDHDVYEMAKVVLAGQAFNALVKFGVEAIENGNKIVFSGCGATGRLSIQLESIWRCYFRDMQHKHPEIYKNACGIENSIFSIMTGGDYALIRSVEYFEDYKEFGRQQVIEMGINKGDVLVAITEGGETSSVLGTVDEAAGQGAKVFLCFNNPADILAKHIERSRKAIKDPRVTVLDLYCGPMAIAGSTRMQATTSELLIAGAAMEMVLNRSLKNILSEDQIKQLHIHDIDYAVEFNSLLNELSQENNTKILGDYLKMEEELYRENGLVTYFANEFLLDIFTDTTERAPTFMLPPFKKYDDEISQPSWAFVKNPLFPTSKAWEHVLGRSPRCLEWDQKIYQKMGAPESLVSFPPQLDKNQIVKFHIGNEEDSSRYSKTPNIAVNVLGNGEIESSSFKDYKKAFEDYTTKFQNQSSLIVGKGDKPADYRIVCSPAQSTLSLLEHLAVKLVLNTISSGTMVLMGRIKGNWMSWVEVSNKKLRDRGIRLISELCEINYKEACYALHESLDELNSIDLSGKEKPSPVQFTIKKVRERNLNN